ncbi:MAG: hypothetical protein RMK19_06465 [Bacteroidia bacterium]|nr:hypothetical protein [Bacteroidia bacterium]MDW8015637.1 hypothetical protein [Bacteroidia bacterium]
MRFLLFAPYGYALALLILGFIAAKRQNQNAYFWGALLIGEASRFGQMLFLIQNFGQPIYVFELQGRLATLSYTGLYIAGIAALMGALGGLFLYWRDKKPFAGLWIALLSVGEGIILGVLRLFL